MGRIQKAYETRFRWLLRLVHARRIDQGIDWLLARARRLSLEQHLRPADALTQVAQDLASRPAFQKRSVPAPTSRFFCDAGLGGLARWLRAAGYDAAWEAGIDDDVLLKEARKLAATVLTTDSMLMERRVIRDCIIPAFWLPPTLSIGEQLMLVLREFALPLQERRCMSCGGTLLPADKEALRDRIPPRTYRWRNEYYLCSRCGKLFWHGTHWDRIERELQRVAEKTSGPKF
jgi:uncharacterized protein